MTARVWWLHPSLVSDRYRLTTEKPRSDTQASSALHHHSKQRWFIDTNKREESQLDVWFNGFVILLCGQWKKAMQISAVCRAWACYYRPGNQMISLAPAERPSFYRMARDTCNLSVKCLLQTCMLENLVTNRWLLFEVVVELLEGEASLKVGCWGRLWGLWASLTIVYSLLLGLLYMEPSLTVSDHHGWGHTHHHAFPAVSVN